MQVSGIESSGSLLRAAIQQQLNTNILSKVHSAQQAQGEAALAGIKAAADEAEQASDGDERGGRFQATA